MARMTQTVVVIDNNITDRIQIETSIIQNTGIAYYRPRSMHLNRKLLQTLEEYAAVRLDSIFLSLDMLEQNAYHFLMNIRSSTLLATTPVVAMSSQLDSIDHARSAGFDGWIGKPIHAALFAHQVHVLMTNRTLWSQAVDPAIETYGMSRVAALVSTR